MTRGKPDEKFDGTTYSIEFDKNGRRASLQEARSMGTAIYRYSYRSDGTRIRTFQIDSKRVGSWDQPVESGSATVVTYDKSTNSIAEVEYNPSSELRPVVSPRLLFRSYIYYFDAKNRLTKRIVLSREGKLVSGQEFHYGDNGPPTDARTTSGEEVFSTITYSYQLDDKGNWIKQTAAVRFSNSKLNDRTLVKYRKISYYDK